MVTSLLPQPEEKSATAFCDVTDSAPIANFSVWAQPSAGDRRTAATGNATQNALSDMETKPVMSSVDCEQHLGLRFEIRRRGYSWFWLLVDPRARRAATGATADRAQARHEARVTIEELLEAL